MNNYHKGLTLRRLLWWIALLAFLFIFGVAWASQKDGLENLQLYEDDGSPDYVVAPPLFIQKNALAIAQIRKCESGDSHYGKNGEVIVSRTKDVGLYQINLKTWEQEAKRLGYDIWTPEGNEQMAFHVLSVQSLSAWVCWKK